MTAAMHDENISVARDRTIATVMLNRPGKLNALTKAMWRGLGDARTRLRSLTRGRARPTG